MHSSMLSVRNLRKEFASVVAVDGVSFDIEHGEVLGLLGPNGAGKTTTIRIILNILQPDRGEVLYGGRPFTPAVRDSIGYLPEERGLYKKQRVLDTLAYFGQLRGMTSQAARAEAVHWLKRFEIEHYASRRSEELSKGNQQKVQFIASILHNPSLVILDEPFSGLDPINQLAFKDVLLDLKRSGKAVVYSTHQMDQAEKLSDSICLINRGRVVLQGGVSSVKERYGRNAVYIEFGGDGTFLKSLPGVASAILYKNAAEVELAEDVSSHGFLASVVERLEIRKFERREPSLESIFMRVVGGKDSTVPGRPTEVPA